MTTVLMPVRSDTLPEHSTYRDGGCEVASSCLRCSLPMCKFDDPGWVQRESRRGRDKAILRARREEDLSVSAVATRFRVSTRTVHRVLQTGGATRREPESGDAGPVIPVLELKHRSLFHPRTPLPRLELLLASGRRTA